MEAVGAGRSRTRVKRRKAVQAGELAGSSEARFPLGACDCSGDGIGLKSVGLTPGSLLGSA